MATYTATIRDKHKELLLVAECYDCDGPKDALVELAEFDDFPAEAASIELVRQDDEE